MIVSLGAGNERLNTVPLPELPPNDVVPYKVLPDKIKLAYGYTPSLLMPVEGSRAVKLYRFAKPVPSVLTPNTVPTPSLPPARVVPYSVLPAKINPTNG